MNVTQLTDNVQILEQVSLLWSRHQRMGIHKQDKAHVCS